MFFDALEFVVFVGVGESILGSLVWDLDGNEVGEGGVGSRYPGEMEVGAVCGLSLNNDVLIFHFWNLLGWLDESKVGAEGEMVGAEAGAGGASEWREF